MAPAYLLSIMIDYASKHLDPALTPQVLLKSANLIKEIVWVSKQVNYLKQVQEKTFLDHLWCGIMG